MERGARSRIGIILAGVSIAGGLVLAARLYLELLPYSPALGAIMVIGTGSALAFLILHIEQRMEQLRTDVGTAETPPS